ITRTMRPSMLELMDSICINAAEDQLRMGLDRDAAAMLLVQSDEAPGHAAAEIAAIEQACTDHGASECYSTDDADAGAAFIVARRIAISALEKRGALLHEDVGVPIPRLSDLVSGIAEIGAACEVTIAVVAHAGDGNTHPLVVLDPNDQEQQQRCHDAYGR